MNVLVTGGAGYIGSHICVKLIESGITPIVVDDFRNSDKELFINGIKNITNTYIQSYNDDVSYKLGLENIFTYHDIDAVIHLSGYKYVGESVAHPMWYYQNNLETTIALLEVMDGFNCHNLIFSSSCTVYGNGDGKKPITEDAPFKPCSPYGRTKAMQEMMLEDLFASDNKWNITTLRYFNPIGSHESGLIGDYFSGKPETLMNNINAIATHRIVSNKEINRLSIFGSDYSTKDGTCVRDYIHIEDLADAHVKALKNLSGYKKYNIGTGVGVSVLELIKLYNSTNNVDIPFELADRRSGDVESIYCDPSLAMKELHWKPTHTLEDACVSSYKFAKYYKETHNC